MEKVFILCGNHLDREAHPGQKTGAETYRLAGRVSQTRDSGNESASILVSLLLQQLSKEMKGWHCLFKTTELSLLGLS